jgi:murein DD-endopeptidase MepM/ murein hydrolase activator NlpD
MNLLIGTILFAMLQGHSVGMTVAPARLHPGSPFMVTVSGLVTGTTYIIEFDKRTLHFTGSGTAAVLLGVNLGHPEGEDSIELYGKGIAAPLTAVSIDVHSHAYPSQYLKLPENFVKLTPAELKRAMKEQEELDKIFASDRTAALWRDDFILPVHGIITTPFGVKRFLNGEPRSPHTGIDIAGKAGTPVVATNNGIVCFEGDLFFGGNSILINHGQGIYSMYFHLGKYAVKNGAQVKKGQTVGYIGDTGRVTGPSLHFGIRIVDSKIDPELLFLLTSKK